MDKNQVQLQYGVSAKNKQWGNPYCETTEKYVSFPISFNNLYVITEAHQVNSLSDFKMVSIYQHKNTGFTINVNANGYVMLYIAIGS